MSCRSNSRTTAGRGRPSVAGKNACTTFAAWRTGPSPQCTRTESPRPSSAGVHTCYRRASLPVGAVAPNASGSYELSFQFENHRRARTPVGCRQECLHYVCGLENRPFTAMYRTESPRPSSAGVHTCYRRASLPVGALANNASGSYELSFEFENHRWARTPAGCRQECLHYVLARTPFTIAFTTAGISRSDVSTTVYESSYRSGESARFESWSSRATVAARIAS